jgi:hypothetical protein
VRSYFGGIGDLRGRPPLAPLARAAAAFASDVALPPRRPSATAAGFLRGGIAGAQGRVIGVPRGAHLLTLRWGPCGHVLREFAAKLFVFAEARLGGVLGGCGRHRRIEPNRLGFVKGSLMKGERLLDAF